MAGDAHSVHCEGCGGSLPLAGLVPPQVTCPFCARVQAVPLARRQALAHYERDVSKQLGVAGEERARAEAWQQWTGGRGGRSRGASRVPLVAFGVLFIGGPLLAVLAQAMVSSKSEELRVAGTLLVPIGVPVVGLAALIGYFVWYYGGRRRADAAALPVATPGHCPRCGAESLLSPGQVLARCAYCGAALLPSPTMMAHGLGAAENERHRAELARYRAERSGMAATLRASAGNIMPYVVVGSFLPLTFGGALAFTASAIHDDATARGLPGIWALAGVNVAVLAIVVARRRARRARWAHVLAVASHAFVHHPLVGIDGLVDWLNLHWAGPIPLEELYAGALFRASAVVMGDFVGMIAVNPDPLSPRFDPYVAVYLAAAVPVPHHVPPEAAVLASLGFHLTVDAAGLRALATGRNVERLRKSMSGGEDVATVADALLRAARSLGARTFETAPPR